MTNLIAYLDVHYSSLQSYIHKTGIFAILLFYSTVDILRSSFIVLS